MKRRALFLDGKMVSPEKKLLASLAPGVTCGRGAFETMRVYRGKILFLEDHLARLIRSLKVLKIKTAYSEKKFTLDNMINETIEVYHKVLK